MARKERISGGEKNNKSGQKWTREELVQVFNLYISDDQLKIHESNKSIEQLAVKLGRTSRSVEAQLLMFRSLDKLGLYGYRNMNTICKSIWKDYIEENVK